MWNCFTEYASKFGKLSSGHRTGKGQFSLQSQRMSMPKYAQTTAQLHSSHTLVKSCSKFTKPGFNSIWTMNFQISKLDLEKAKKPEIKLPTSIGSFIEKARQFQKKNLLRFHWLSQNLWLCGSQQTVEIYSWDGNTRPLTWLLSNLYAGQETTVRTGREATNWF